MYGPCGKYAFPCGDFILSIFKKALELSRDFCYNLSMYDVFISYRREGGFAVARLLYEHFKSVGLNPFFDLEELRSGQFNKKLYASIDESENFILVLPPDSLDRCVSEDDWLRLEIEHAMLKNKNIIPLMFKEFKWPAELPPSIQELRHYNGVVISNEYFDASIAKLLTMMKGVSIENGTVKRTESKVERVENPYFVFDDKKEKRRLAIQRNLVKDFDNVAYKKVLEKYDGLTVLDLGSNIGDFIMDRLGFSDKVKKIVGLEYDGTTVDAANEKYGGERVKFYKCNVEAEDFAETLEEIMHDAGVESFDVINASMLLLHLKSPFRVLKAVRRALSPDGTIIIKDIDDGFNVAYPDEDGSFARVIDICRKNETAGYRHSGRQIFTLLSRAGYANIKLENLGLSTIGLDYDARSAFFDTYFSFIIDDLKVMLERYPQDKRIKDDYEWYKKSYEDLEEKFQDADFFFTLGFVLYTATKR